MVGSFGYISPVCAILGYLSRIVIVFSLTCAGAAQRSNNTEKQRQREEGEYQDVPDQ
jgi:hypothetical protein